MITVRRLPYGQFEVDFDYTDLESLYRLKSGYHSWYNLRLRGTLTEIVEDFVYVPESGYAPIFIPKDWREVTKGNKTKIRLLALRLIRESQPFFKANRGRRVRYYEWAYGLMLLNGAEFDDNVIPLDELQGVA